MERKKKKIYHVLNFQFAAVTIWNLTIFACSYVVINLENVLLNLRPVQLLDFDLSYLCPFDFTNIRSVNCPQIWAACTQTKHVPNAA